MEVENAPESLRTNGSETPEGIQADDVQRTLEKRTVAASPGSRAGEDLTGNSRPDNAGPDREGSAGDRTPEIRSDNAGRETGEGTGEPGQRSGLRNDKGNEQDTERLGRREPARDYRITEKDELGKGGSKTNRGVRRSMQNVWIPQIISIFMLLIAFNPSNPYGYYTLLRIVLCVDCIYLAVYFFKIKKSEWTWIMGVTALVYNPVIPVHLTRDIWSVINIMTIAMLVSTFWAYPNISLEEYEHTRLGKIYYEITGNWNMRKVMSIIVSIILTILLLWLVGVNVA